MAQQNCPLLDLPAELRNLIYSSCKEKHAVSPTKHDRNYAKSDFRALTQVCRQIREEFHPVYMEETNIEVDWPDDLDSYLEAFYPMGEAHEMRHYRGDIYITIPETYLDEDIDLTLMLRLQAVAPRIQFYVEVIDHPEAAPPVWTEPFGDQLNELLQYTVSPSNQMWHHMLSAEIVSIILHCHGETPTLHFQTSKQVALKAEDWWVEMGLPTLHFFNREFWWDDGAHRPVEDLRKRCLRWSKGFEPQ